MPGYAAYSITFRDHNGELSNVRVHTDEVSGAALDYDAMLVEFVALQDAIAAITLGTKQKAERIQGNLVTNADAADINAQRERKWLVQYHDATSLKNYTLELPCADLARLDPNDKGNANIGDAGLVDAFITALQAYGTSPTGGAIVVDEISHVGRNN